LNTSIYSRIDCVEPNQTVFLDILIDILGSTLKVLWPNPGLQSMLEEKGEVIEIIACAYCLVYSGNIHLLNQEVTRVLMPGDVLQ